MVKEIGMHRLRTGNAMADLDDLMQGEKADLVYSDPPWGDGNLSYWATQNKKDTGKSEGTVGYRQFMTHFFDLCTRHGAPVVAVEYGLRWEKEIIELAEEAGYDHWLTCHPYYRGGGKKMPMHLHLFGTHKPVSDLAAFQEAVDDTTGLTTVRTAMKPLIKAGDVVLDPCAGKGLGAQVAAEAGARFRGNELNSQRLAEAEKRLRKLT